MVSKPDKTAGQQGGGGSGRFKPGQSGNPAGRPTGARHRTSLAIEALLDGEAEKLTRKAVEMALDGDTTAMRLCLERLCPPRKSRPIMVDLPAINDATSISAALGSVLSHVATGQITPEEGALLGGLLETHRKAVEFVEYEARLQKLEEAINK